MELFHLIHGLLVFAAALGCGFTMRSGLANPACLQLWIWLCASAVWTTYYLLKSSGGSATDVNSVGSSVSDLLLYAFSSVLILCGALATKKPTPSFKEGAKSCAVYLLITYAVMVVVWVVLFAFVNSTDLILATAVTLSAGTAIVLMYAAHRLLMLHHGIKGHSSVATLDALIVMSFGLYAYIQAFYPILFTVVLSSTVEACVYFSAMLLKVVCLVVLTVVTREAIESRKHTPAVKSVLEQAPSAVTPEGLSR